MQQTVKTNSEQSGIIVSFFSGIARIQGLAGVFLHEVLVDEHKTPAALVVGFEQGFAEVLFFDENFDTQKRIFRSFQSFSIPVAAEHIGRVVNGLGKPIDGLGDIQGESRAIFTNSPQIFEREPVTDSLTTGIKLIDTSLPLGRGQRELIIGDRKVGKSTLAADIVLNQKNARPPVFCIYVICGQKKEKVSDLIRLFEEHNAFLYTTIVASTARDSFAEQYLAPFVGTTIGEYFRDKGQDALIVYDDLSKHANIYRDIALLFKRPPGREAYPADIFSLHAGLLERSAKLSQEKGGGSLTALPIIETQEQDITSFVPTNLISITDGQIYLERGLFQKGFLPAVNVGLSVSRVGAYAQPPPLKAVVGGIRLALAQHKELQKLIQLETILSDEAQKKIHRGNLILQLLRQEKHTRVSWEEQVVLFFAVEAGFFDDLSNEKWSGFEKLLLELVRNRYFKVLSRIGNGRFDRRTKEKISEIAHDAHQEFLVE